MEKEKKGSDWWTKEIGKRTGITNSRQDRLRAHKRPDAIDKTAILMTANRATDGTLGWTRRFGGTTNSDHGLDLKAIAVDAIDFSRLWLPIVGKVDVGFHMKAVFVILNQFLAVKVSKKTFFEKTNQNWNVLKSQL